MLSKLKKYTIVEVPTSNGLKVLSNTYLFEDDVMARKFFTETHLSVTNIKYMVNSKNEIVAFSSKG